MELVYLWVEEYKNIKNQGFNFSPKFTCKYENGELTIEDKKDYVSIFPENINVTAIVGENGSGKTRIVEFANNHYVNDLSKILIYCQENQFIILNNFDRKGFKASFIESNKKYIVKNLQHDTKALSIIQYQNLVLETSNKVSITNSCKLTNTSYVVNRDENNDMQFIIHFLKEANMQIPFKTPNYISLDLFYNEAKLNMLKETIDHYIKKYKINSNFIAKELFYQDNFEYKIQLLKFYLLVTYLHFQNVDLGNLYFDIVYVCNQNNPKNIEELLAIYIQHINNDRSILQKVNGILDFISQNWNEKNPLGFSIKIEELPHNFINDYKFLTSKLTSYNQENCDCIGFSFDESVSSGEYQFLLIFAQINEYFKNKNILFIDEGDVFLHPNWQKKYIQYLIRFLTDNFHKNFHLILTTHSPFILSDLPKENVIFLEEGKQVDINIETFGANIHTLLSHGFFMKDGLMGEFAKSKIEEIKKFYELVQKMQTRMKKTLSTKELIKKSFERRKTRFYNVQSIIGEPFIKTVMKNYLDELELVLFDTTMIDKELKALEKRKRHLEKLKNAQN